MDGDRRHVLIAGGGVAALEAALALRDLAGDRVRVELLAPEPRFWYRAPSVAEPFGRGEVRHYDLGELAREMGATFTLGELTSVDVARHLAYVEPTGATPYETLLLAAGAVPAAAVPGAITFRGPADTDKITQLLAELEGGSVRHVSFVVPAGATWGLPAYELALMTSSWLAERAIEGVAVSVVSPESRPLQLFGREASDAVAGLMARGGIGFHAGGCATEAREGELLLVGGDIVVADRVVALPRLHGPAIAGLPQTFEGFVAVDGHGRVPGIDDVYAAGDVTTFAVKQGGIAAQQAEAAAEAIAADAGADVTPRPFRPVIRGLLLTGAEPRFLHSELGGGGTAWVSNEPLWWPPAKIVGRYLSPFLASIGSGGMESAPETPGVVVEVELDDASDQRRDRVIAAAVEDALHEHDVRRVADVMSVEPLVVAPEDTLGEIAERMLSAGTRPALVVEYGRLIGILASRDLLAAVAARTHSSEARARQWMTAEPITVTAETPLEVASALMADNDVRHLPVVDGERAIGLVGQSDLARAREPGRAGHAGVGLGF
jgi:sulfide:quinone oxidoreductase